MELNEFIRRFRRVPLWFHVLVILILVFTWSWVLSEMSKPQVFKCGSHSGTKEELLRDYPLECGGNRYVNISGINFSALNIS